MATDFWLVAITFGTAGINLEVAAFLMVRRFGADSVGWRWYQFAAAKG